MMMEEMLIRGGGVITEEDKNANEINLRKGGKPSPRGNKGGIGHWEWFLF